MKSSQERVQDTIPVVATATATKPKTQDEIQEENYIKAKMNKRIEDQKKSK